MIWMFSYIFFLYFNRKNKRLIFLKPIKTVQFISVRWILFLSLDFVTMWYLLAFSLAFWKKEVCSLIDKYNSVSVPIQFCTILAHVMHEFVVAYTILSINLHLNLVNTTKAFFFFLMLSIYSCPIIWI